MANKENALIVKHKDKTQFYSWMVIMKWLASFQLLKQEYALFYHARR